MKKLFIYVCENYISEFNYLVDNEGLDDIEIVSFRSYCDGGVSAGENLSSGLSLATPDSDAVLVCSHLCRASRRNGQDKMFSRNYESVFCYSHIVSDHFAHFFSEEGYYAITTGWLTDWEEHMQRQGFTQNTAREFYKRYFSKLVFLNTGIYEDPEKKLDELSLYLDLPAKSISVSIEPIRNLLKSIVSDWKMRDSKGDNPDDMRELKELNAQNAAVLNIMSKIAGAEYKRDVISILDQIWMILFGAGKSNFWSFDELSPAIPKRVKNLNFSNNQSFILDVENNTFFALLELKGEKFGIIEVGDFLFPDHVGKYTEMFNSIIKIAALAISNAQRYEELFISKNNYEYSSYHDGLTGVFNRTYFNKVVKELSGSNLVAVYSVDLDGLKEINDSLGHSKGDVLIKQAAVVLKKTFRESDYIFRMGGDEFTVFVDDCDQRLAENLLNRLQENVIKGNLKNAMNLSLSAGFCVGTGSHDKIERIVHEADLNMYADKRKRKAEAENP
ncbi:MAG: diguanylate cyclase [Spirochaetales bacterium]|nr:diguanylate cyclase [Spirochaetales bacterium]